MSLLFYTLLFSNICLVLTDYTILPTTDVDLTFGHHWNKREDMVTIYFDISNSSLNAYRYYFFDFRPFASHNHTESFPRQRLTDTHNSLHILGLHENDYVTCVSFIDEYENRFQPRYSCYEFTIGEKTIGSHHGAKTGYLAPLLVAFAFVIHVFIAVVHHIKAKKYAQKLLQRFIDVDPNVPVERKLSVQHSLKQLDHHRPSASVQRRLSRVTIDTDDDDENHFFIKETNNEPTVHVLSHHHRRKSSVKIMRTIPEYNP